MKILHKGKTYYYINVPSKFVVRQLDKLKAEKTLNKFKKLDNLLNSLDSYLVKEKTAQKVEFNHVYLPSSSLKKTVKFFKDIFDIEPENEEGDRWVDYHKKNKPFFGIKNKKYLKNTGSVNTITFHTDDIDKFYDKVKNKINIFEKLKRDKNIKNYDYYYFRVKDPDGNIITVCQYKKNKIALKYKVIQGRGYSDSGLTYIDIGHHQQHPVLLWAYDTKTGQFDSRTAKGNAYHDQFFPDVDSKIYGRYDPEKKETSVIHLFGFDSIPDQLFDIIRNKFGNDTTVFIFEDN
jgi:predicted enzyme related to lactoylglutathione lyase